MPETTKATTSRRDSNELPFVIHPIADLVVDVAVSIKVQQEVQAEITRLRQVSVVVHVIGVLPSRGELRHLLQARFQEDLSRVVDIQFLGKGCYHVEFLAAEMVMKLLCFFCHVSGFIKRMETSDATYGLIDWSIN